MILYKAKRLDNGEWVEGFPVKVVTSQLEDEMFKALPLKEKHGLGDICWCICISVSPVCTGVAGPVRDDGTCGYYPFLYQGTFDENRGVKKLLHIVDPETIEPTEELIRKSDVIKAIYDISFWDKEDRTKVLAKINGIQTVKFTKEGDDNDDDA